MLNSNGLPAQLYFLHIPKTAGTSLRHWLQDLYDEDDWLPCYGMDDLEKFPKTRIAEYKLFCGHFSNALYEHVDGVETVTWLREPIARTLSSFIYSKRGIDEEIEAAKEAGQTDEVHRLVKRKEQTLTEFCQAAFRSGNQDNLQIRHLTGCVKSGAVDSPAVCHSELLELAKERLRTMLFFGIVEWMNPCIDLLCWRLARPQRKLQYKLNTSKRSLAITTEERDLMVRLNDFDIKLYKFAKRELRLQLQDFFDSVYGKSNEEFSKIIEGYHSDSMQLMFKESMSARYLRRPDGSQRSEKVDVDFSKGTIEQGWLRRSKNEFGTFIRWAGPDTRSSIFVPLSAEQDYEIKFIARHFMRDSVIKNMRIWIGNRRIPFAIRKTACGTRRGYEFEVVGKIPASTIDANTPMTEIVFETKATFRQKTTDGKVRQVSFATDRIELIPLAGKSRQQPNLAARVSRLIWPHKSNVGV